MLFLLLTVTCFRTEQFNICQRKKYYRSIQNSKTKMRMTVMDIKSVHK